MNNGKYNYQFVLNEKMVQQGDSSHAKILQQVEPGSMVLECGPADGMMTRYLKETLDCTVYILELDSECFAHASHYADGGVCANLEEDDWMSSLPDGVFDYILYADVLEHLRDPKSVLIKMKRFLKPDGCVLLSVPNVANGDIIANLLCDQFTYTPLGLLDNTHVHLFARKNLHDMIYSSGYYLALETCTRVPLFATEQGKFIPEKRRNALKQSLMDHPTYHIYQFICRLSQTKTQSVSDVDDATETAGIAVESRFYFDLGAGLSEENRINVRPEVQPDGRLRYTVKLPEGCTAVRYDPTELRRCILREMTAEGDGMPISIQPLNGLSVGGAVFFSGEDPQIGIVPPKGTRVLTLEAVLILLGLDSWNEAEKLMLELKAVLAQETKKLDSERIVHTATAQKLDLECAAHAATTQELNSERVSHAATAQELAISETARDTLHRTCVRAMNSAAKSLAECDALRSELSTRNAELESMKNSRSWKITKPLRAMKQAFTPKNR
ncbi:hypothetical protein SDC9_60623 [bioreactor metagenome]|uniref:2-polyprenyl-6-hydroxyphenol methylase n=1 Tax=bioreactor metagenome TaxID=1076179 RepID=A0A644XES0_9ZZZZ